MKAKSLMLSVFCATLLGAFSCTNLEPYKIDAPEDLADKIAEYQEESAQKNSGDTTYVSITAQTVGNSDFSSGWWSAWSQSFEIPAGKLLHLEFTNHSDKVENWHNWVLVFANVGGGIHSSDEDSAYSESLALRADAYGWASGWNSALTYIDIDGKTIADFDAAGEDFWATWKEKIDGAYHTMEIDRSAAGVTFITTAAEATDGSIINYTYNFELPDPITYAFLTVENAYLEMHDAYLIPSKVTEIKDQNATAISVSGIPATVEIGTSLEDVLSAAKFTVTWEDGTSTDAAPEDVTVTCANGSFAEAAGDYTLLYSFSKTKQGNYGKSVAGMATVKVTLSVKAIEAQANAYLIGSASKLTLSPAAIVVKAIYSDESTGLLKPNQYTVEFPDGPVFEGTPGTVDNAYTVKFTTASGEELTANGSLTVAASSLPAQAEMVGALDFTNGWWTTFTQDWKVADGESQSVTMKVGSDNLGNWHSPCTILRKADFSEYGVVRMDNYGWGASMGDACALLTTESNWNWDIFASSIDGSKVTITVANNNGFASIRYYVEYANEEKHFQYYDGIAVDSNDVQFAIVTEESYLIFEEEEVTPPEPGDATIASIAVTKQPAVTTYYFFDNTSLDFRTGGMEVTATYTDATTQPVALTALDFSAITVAEGAQDVTVSLKEDSSISTTVSINLVKGSYGVGATDLTGGFWSDFTTADKVIPAGESRSFEMDVYSNGINIWNGPYAVLRKSSLAEYAVVRVDNWGWGDGFTNADADKVNDGTIGLLQSMLNNSHMKITATNHGDGTATIHYDMLWPNGETHYQDYLNITVDSADVQLGVTVEGCYLVIVE